MISAQIPIAAQKLLDILASTFPTPQSIWLIGSRANGRARPESDTDFLVFGSKEFIAAASGAISNAPSVDVLVVHDGEHFEDIFNKKRGSLSSWSWTLLNEQDATYEGRKFVADSDLEEEVLPMVRPNSKADLGNYVEYQERAVRVWSR